VELRSYLLDVRKAEPRQRRFKEGEGKAPARLSNCPRAIARVAVFPQVEIENIVLE
jgi:hypothetical protein